MTVLVYYPNRYAWLFDWVWEGAPFFVVYLDNKRLGRARASASWANLSLSVWCLTPQGSGVEGKGYLHLMSRKERVYDI